MIRFYNNGKIITENIIREHTNRRYFNGCAHQEHTKRYLANKFKLTNPPIPLTIMTTSQLNIPVIIGWTVFGLTFVGGSIFIALYLFQKSQRNKYYAYSNDDEMVIDITAEDF